MSIINRWNTVLKSGNRAIEVVLAAVEHVKEHGDTSLLANMIAAADKTDNAPYSKRLRKVVGLVFPEAKLRKRKDGGLSIIRGDAFDQSMVVTMQAALDKGYSFIGPKFGELIGEQKEEQSEGDVFAKRVKADAKWIAKAETVSLEQYITALRQEYAKQIALKVAS